MSIETFTVKVSSSNTTEAEASIVRETSYVSAESAETVKERLNINCRMKSMRKIFLLFITNAPFFV